MNSEYENLLKFVAEKCDEAEEPLNVCELAKEFKDNTGSDSNPENLRGVIRNYRKRVHKIPDERTRAKQLFALSVKVENDLLNTLRQHARVVLNSEQKIIEYEAHDGSLTLKGDQSHSSKCARRKNRLTAAIKEEVVSDSEDDLYSNQPAPKRSRDRSSNSHQPHSSSSNPVRRTRGSGNSSGVTVPTGTSYSGISSQMHSNTSLSHQSMQANQKIAQLEKAMEIMRKRNKESDLEMKKADEEHKNEKKTWRKEKNEMEQKITSLMQKERSSDKSYKKELAEINGRHKEKMLEMKKRMGEADATHHAEIKKMKVEVAQNLKEAEGRHQNNLEQMRKKTGEAVLQQKEQEEQHREKHAKLLKENASLQKQVDDQRGEIDRLKKEPSRDKYRLSVNAARVTQELKKACENRSSEICGEASAAVPMLANAVSRNETIDHEKLENTYTRKISELEALHKKQIEQMEKKIEDSARLQKEKNDVHKEQKATLQKQIDDLLVNQKTVACLINSMLNNTCDTPSTSSTVDEIIDQVKITITKEAKSD